MDKIGPFGDAFSLDNVSIEETAKDSDSVTSSSVSTVVSRSSTHVDCTVEGAAPMSKPESGYDARFGARALSTFGSPNKAPKAEVAEKAKPVIVQEEAKNGNGVDLRKDVEIKAVVKDKVEIKDKGQEEEKVAADSETDTESESTLSEKKPLLGPAQTEADVMPLSQSESDDTDSISTPTDSPCKGRLDSLDVQPPALSRTGLYTI